MTEQLEGQESLFDLDTWSGKMYQEPSVVTEEKTSESSSKKQQGSPTVVPLFLDLRGGGVMRGLSWETTGLSLGGYMTHSFGEYHNDGAESHLSQILEDNPHPKYSLSAKACQGILRRAERRGKKLPETLQKALEKQSVFKNDLENQGGVKEFLSRTKEQEHCQHSITNTFTENNNGTCYCLQGNGIDRADTAGCNGKGWKEDKSYTLNTIDRPAVYVYNGENITSPTNKAQPKEGDPCHTLDQDSRNYVVFEPRSQDGVPRVGNQNISPTLNTGGVDNDNHVSYNKTFTHNAYDTIVESETSSTLKANGENYGGGRNHM